MQSLVPEHAELYLLLSMVVPVPWLERVPTYKEQQENLKDKDLSSIGFLGYPLLQTADVAIYDARFVPVGEDQVAHLELAREVGAPLQQLLRRRVLVEPQPLLTTFARLPGLDGDKKMSKSLGNTIHLSDSRRGREEEGHGRCTRTRSACAPTFPGTVEGNPVFIYHDAFNPDTAEVDDLKARYRAGQGRRRRGEDEAGQRAQRAPRSDSRAPRRGRWPSPAQLRDILFEGSQRRARRRAGDDGHASGTR